MLKKQNSRGKTVKVTFSLPKDIEGTRICLLGDFNNWDENATPMQLDGKGNYSTTLNLEKGHQYEFRYLISRNGGLEWYNDAEADQYVPNPYGSDNAVIST